MRLPPKDPVVEKSGFLHHAFRTPIHYPPLVPRIALTGLILLVAWPLCWRTPLLLTLARSYPPETLSSPTWLAVLAFPVLRGLAWLVVLAALVCLAVKRSLVADRVLVALFLFVLVEYVAVAFALSHVSLPTIAAPIH